MAKNDATQSSTSKSEQAYVYLRENILSRKFSPGYRLVLASIAADLDMSVVPVREAIRRLEAEDLVSFERNVGACVKMIDEDQYINSMRTLAILEGAATADGSVNLTAEQLVIARNINDLMTKTLDNFNPRAFTLLNQEFHSTLLLGCGNKRLTDLVKQEWALLGNLRDSTFGFVPERARESVEEHAQILELIESGAPQSEVETAVRNHREATMRAYLIRKGEEDPLLQSPGTSGGDVA